MARYDANARCVSPNLRRSRPPARYVGLATTQFGQPSYAQHQRLGQCSSTARAHTRYRTDSNRSSRIPQKGRTHLILPSDGKEKDEADSSFLSAFWGRRLRLRVCGTRMLTSNIGAARGGVVIATRPHRHDHREGGGYPRLDPSLACVRVRARGADWRSRRGCRYGGARQLRGCPSMRGAPLSRRYHRMICALGDGYETPPAGGVVNAGRN